MKKVNIGGVLFFAFVGLCLYVWSILKEDQNYFYASIVCWAAVIIYIFVIVLNNHSHKKYIFGKYPDKDIANAILKGKFWQGQTKGQLIDSIGRPSDVDTKVLKTKTKETWKYFSIGKNRYALKVILENDTVIGWDKKA